MIPKIIHYCWFGGKDLPKSAEKCIASWRKYFPEYEIKRWDESNYDVNAISYTAQAYAAKKYAFVSDYARFDILYKYGGLYFDTDVEVINSMDDIIALGSFMGRETPYDKGLDPRCLGVAPGLGLGVEKSNSIIGELKAIYERKNYTISSGVAHPETVVTITTDLLCAKGLKNVPGIQRVDDLTIYPPEYFCPISIKDGKLHITENTRSIHWYDQSWQSPWRKYGRRLTIALGGAKLKGLIKRIIFK